MTSGALTPKSNGMVERCNRTIIEAIRAHVANKADWDLSLRHALYAVRTAQHSVLRTSPANLLMGFQPRDLGRRKTDPYRVVLLTNAAESAERILVCRCWMVDMSSRDVWMDPVDRSIDQNLRFQDSLVVSGFHHAFRSDELSVASLCNHSGTTDMFTYSFV